jgi:hypothetical protein
LLGKTRLVAKVETTKEYLALKDRLASFIEVEHLAWIIFVLTQRSETAHELSAIIIKK